MARIIAWLLRNSITYFAGENIFLRLRCKEKMTGRGRRPGRKI